MKTREVIDAVVAGVNALALPAHRTFKYHRPLSLSGHMGAAVPALVVSPAIDKPMLLATNEEHEWVHRLLVTFYAGQMSAMTMGSVDQAMAADTLDHVGLIVDLFASWADQVEGLPFQAEATLGEIHYGAIEGGIWCSEVNLQIKHWER